LREKVKVQQQQQMSAKKSSKPTTKQAQDDPMLMSELLKNNKDEAQYYKDSVNILGVSLNELDDFMNPSPSTKQPKNELASHFLSS